MVNQERVEVEAGKQFRLVAAGKGFVGWVSKDFPQELFADLSRDPDGFFYAPASEILKSVPKAGVIRRAVKDGVGVGRSVIVKRFQPGSLLRRVGYLILPSPARRCFRAALLLKGASVETPAPLGVLESRSWKSLGASYYITEEITASHSLRALLLRILSDFPEKQARRLKFRLLEEASRLLYRLHSSGIYHRDLKGSNILVREGENPGWELFLVDLDGVSRAARLSWPRRVKNLVQLCRIGRWSGRDIVYFLKLYSDLCSLEGSRRKKLWRKVLALSGRGVARGFDRNQAIGPWQGDERCRRVREPGK